MDIFIKSFNRPYYLDRCLNSIYKQVSGDFTISILDDGTPPEYLEKIKMLHPNISIFRSNNYEKKVKCISDHLRDGKRFDAFNLPSEFWKSHVEKGSDLFLLLEEDIWLTKPIHLDKVIETINQSEICALRLSWNSNPNSIYGTRKKLSDHFEEIIPILPTENLFLLQPVLQNWLKLRSILFKAGILTIHDFLPYYSLYSVTSSFFRKDYWLHLWSNPGNKVDELKQLFYAITWKKSRNARYAKTIHEMANTSFITSSSINGINDGFDMLSLNYQLNESWLHGELDPLQNYPNDFDLSYLIKLLRHRGASNDFIENWSHWITDFKSMYRQLGCRID